MKEQVFVSTRLLPDFSLWEKVHQKRGLVYFDFEMTARCNNNCRHCCINLPAGDPEAKRKELSLQEIKEIADEATHLGALWCLLTGGEPLLRGDFSDIYLLLKRRGVLVSIFTNATLIRPEHIRLFKKYPPRDIEVTVYGIREETYERVTRQPGSFAAFRRGLNLLLRSGIRIRLKAMALRSNVHELPAIARFCRGKSRDYFRFDPFLHLRFEGDQDRNAEIKSERLAPEEIVSLERLDRDRFQALRNGCEGFMNPESSHPNCNHLFHCGAGHANFTLGYDGRFRLCSSLCHPDCVFDLHKGGLTEAWQKFVPQVLNLRSNRKRFLQGCKICPLLNFCRWCPAQAHLETGRMDIPIPYLCEVTHARAKALRQEK